jgi:superfamily II DNA or RNA helicase
MKLTIEPYRLVLSEIDDNLGYLKSKLSIYDNYVRFPKVLWTALLETSDDKFYVPRFIPKGFLPLKNLEIIDHRNDYKVTDPISVRMNGAPRNDIQKDALNYLFDEMNNFRQHTRILDLPTGAGKTFLALCAIARLKAKACIFVHKTTMIETPWIKDILQFTDIKREEICILQGTDKIKSAMKHPEKYKIFICVHQTFEVLAKRNDGEELIKQMYDTLGIGLNIIDEAHKMLLNVFLINMYCPPIYTLCLTATLGRNDYKENQIFRYILPVEDSFRCNSYVETEKIITYCPRTFETEMGEDWKKKFAMDTGVRMSTYCSYIATEEDVFRTFYRHIKEAVINIFDVNPDARITILLGTLELVQKVYDEIATDFVENTVGNFTSMVPVKKRVEELEKQIIISTNKSMDSATDCAVDNLILCVPISSEIELTQMIGRIRHKDNHPDPYFVYDICDTTVQKLKNNFKFRNKVIKKSLAKEIK